jgi:hypothetical protein
MGDACQRPVVPGDDECAGKVQLAATVALPLDGENLVVPAADATPAEVDASPIAAAVKILGLDPTVTLHDSSTTLYQVSCRISKVTIGYYPR